MICVAVELGSTVIPAGQAGSLVSAVSESPAIALVSETVADES